MTYYCGDCSYTGEMSSTDGQCPACLSYNYRSSTKDEKDGKPKQSSPLKLGLLIVLWAYLIIEIYRKFRS